MMYLVLAIVSVLLLVFVFWRRYLLIKKQLDWQKKETLEKNNNSEFEENNRLQDLDDNSEIVKSDDVSQILLTIDLLIKAQKFDEAELMLTDLLLSNQSPVIYHRLAKVYIEKQLFDK